jgi:hypothetical protein
MLGGKVSLCSLAMCLRTISEYKKRSPQMRQCHWSRAKIYGRHSELFGSSFGSGIVSTIVPSLSRRKKKPRRSGVKYRGNGGRKGRFRNKAIFGRGNGFQRLGLLAKAPLPFSPLSFPVADPVSELRSSSCRVVS